jgi:peptide chain release factor 3
VLTRRLYQSTGYQRVLDENEMLEHAGSPFDEEALNTGHLTPVFFGSAVNNFGVQLLLDGFLEHASAPRARSVDGVEIPTASDKFAGFIFKIQANMDPRHRDRLAFVRVCSGRFERDMTVVHTRTGKRVRLSSSHKLFGRDRETMDVAYAGDIVGLVGHGEFGLGDTLSVDEKLTFKEIPRFTPECFAWLQSTNTAQFKRFREGLEQLLQERVVQAIYITDSAQRVPLLAAVGPLQFEVVQYRMQTEYGADSRLETAPWQVMRWISPSVSAAQLEAAIIPTGARLAKDAAGQNVILFSEVWSSQYFADKNPDVQLSELPFDDALAPSS